MRHGTISTVLTTYRRPQLLLRQVDAVLAQSIAPENIVIWHNDPGPEYHEQWQEVFAKCPIQNIVAATPNLGVWPRFSLGLEFASEFFAVFDDDTIPGPRWFENCTNTIAQHDGLLGTVGVRFPGGLRERREYYGWKRPQPEIVEVDLVGHAWFLRREWLPRILSVPRVGFPTCGEDYHLSYALQKHGIKTYCPPHPPEQTDLWGSVDGMALGSGGEALWNSQEEEGKKHLTHNRLLQLGWRTIA